MGGVYWGVSAMALLKRLDDGQRRDELIDWILRCCFRLDWWCE